MKVLKHGDQVRFLICKGCGAELEVVPQDIITSHEDYIDNHNILHKYKSEYLECPECGYKHYTHIYHNGKEVTKEWEKVENARNASTSYVTP